MGNDLQTNSEYFMMINCDYVYIMGSLSLYYGMQYFEINNMKDRKAYA